ncbi:hypothetical protein DRE_01564 [Drechslerella stenobrocha 248]|uniref:Uncharacterized protein n=1 Tax=Drechslerella stenobrocha 248 TaxID=1043628 RepID=W7HUD2_9PEZI|nr:hypothetical protein DRE_01564 [Drechslerella stenobrocha 248]
MKNLVVDTKGGSGQNAKKESMEDTKKHDERMKEPAQQQVTAKGLALQNQDETVQQGRHEQQLQTEDEKIAKFNKLLASLGVALLPGMPIPRTSAAKRSASKKNAEAQAQAPASLPGQLTSAQVEACVGETPPLEEKLPAQETPPVLGRALTQEKFAESKLEEEPETEEVQKKRRIERGKAVDYSLRSHYDMGIPVFERPSGPGDAPDTSKRLTDYLERRLRVTEVPPDMPEAERAKIYGPHTPPEICKLWSWDPNQRRSRCRIQRLKKAWEMPEPQPTLNAPEDIEANRHLPRGEPSPPASPPPVGSYSYSRLGPSNHSPRKPPAVTSPTNEEQIGADPATAKDELLNSIRATESEALEKFKLQHRIITKNNTQDITGKSGKNGEDDTAKPKENEQDAIEKPTENKQGGIEKPKDYNQNTTDKPKLNAQGKQKTKPSRSHGSRIQNNVATTRDEVTNTQRFTPDTTALKNRSLGEEAKDGMIASVFANLELRGIKVRDLDSTLLSYAVKRYFGHIEKDKSLEAQIKW